jgi:hypothetical protein
MDGWMDGWMINKSLFKNRMSAAGCTVYRMQ